MDNCELTLFLATVAFLALIRNWISTVSNNFCTPVMSSSKRKWEELNDSDEDAPTYGKQILPVANLPADFDDEPMDGMQYLFMVRCVACF